MRSIRRMLAAARSEPAVCVRQGRDVFDLHPHLLNCANGTVDLRTGEPRPHRREDHITQLCPTRFDPAAPRDGYLAFLGKVFHGKPEVAEYVRNFSGWVVTGDVSDQSFQIAHGGGSNGKGVLLNLWTHVLGEGEYAHTAPAELLVNDGRDRHPTEKAGLRGKRLVVCSETSEDEPLDEKTMKALTGGDHISARFMRQDFFQFPPTHKLILATNNRPRVKGTDNGVWRRIRLIPFEVCFWKDSDRALDPDADARTGPGLKYDPDFRADPELEERLRLTEAEGVLADMVERAGAFYRTGRTLTPPPAVARATADYRRSEDVIGQFFDARVVADPDGRVRSKDLHEAFKQWWEDEGYPANKCPGPKRFGTQAQARYGSVKGSSVLYKVRLLGPGDAGQREEGRIGGCFGDKPSRARAHQEVNTGNDADPPFLPFDPLVAVGPEEGIL
jgi:putative DNA primase/helicase